MDHDLIKMTASIPPAKKQKALNLLDPLLTNPPPDTITLQHAEQAHGLLQWVGELLVAGRFHLVNFIAAFRSAKASHQSAKVTPALRREARWWRQVLLDWNCVSLMLPPVYMAPAYSYEASPTTDACRSPTFAGAGCWFNGLFDYFEFLPSERESFDIMTLEALTFMLWISALLLHDPSQISGRVWRTRCDNEAWVAICNSGKCNRSPACAVLLEHLHALQCKYHFGILVEWIDTDANLISDLLSRFLLAKFHREIKLIGFPSPTRLQVPDRSSLVSRMMFASSQGLHTLPAP